MAPTSNGIPAPKKRIAVMTSGGDSPGMNGSVRAVIRMAIARGCEAYCVYEGYEGLVEGGDLIRKAQWEDVRGWLSEGGTLIGTARCKAFTERPGRLKAAKNMIDNGINALVICGGDGSLTGADTFRGEWPGLLEEHVGSQFATSYSKRDSSVSRRPLCLENPSGEWVLGYGISSLTQGRSGEDADPSFR